MTETLAYLFAGAVFGLAGGFSPGPTTTVVVSQTLRFGFFDGVKVAIAPALTDAPIVTASVLLVGEIAGFKPVLGCISLLGALFLLYLCFESFRVRGVEIDESQVEPQSIRKGFLANLFNPHPYMFWFVIGAPKLIEAYRISLTTAVGFMVGLYVCLIGSKICVAFLVGRSRGFLMSRGYVYVNRALGLVLGIFALLFFRDAITFFQNASS